jgi:hypothetical protein
MANSVKTLIEKPHKYMIKNVAINETGISINGLNAIDQSLKNKKMIIITKITETVPLFLNNWSQVVE